MTSATSSPHFSCASLRAGAQMRRQRDGRVLAKGVVGGQRLGGIHVERGGSDLARVQRGQQVVLHDDLAAGAIDQAHLRLHFREGRRVQHAARLVGHRHVDGDEVRVPVHIVPITEQLDAERLGAG